MSEDNPWDGLWPDLTPRKRLAKQVDLGLAISGATLEPGETRTLREISNYCGVSFQAIARIEDKAMRKFKLGLAELGFHKLDDILPQINHDESEEHSRSGIVNTSPPKM